MSTVKRKCKVVMLATNEKANLWLDNISSKLYHGTATTTSVIYQHIYIVSNDKIKNGDWYLNSLNYYSIHKYAGEKISNYGNYKIIATTNSSLMIGFENKQLNSIHLPQPSLSFILKFVEEYNKDNVITRVLVEYEEDNRDIENYIETSIEPYDVDFNDSKVKVNLKNNSITIKKAKDCWNRKEVIKLLKNYRKYVDKYPSVRTSDKRLDEWIQDKI